MTPELTVTYVPDEQAQRTYARQRDGDLDVVAWTVADGPNRRPAYRLALVARFGQAAGAAASITLDLVQQVDDVRVDARCFVPLREGP